MVIQSGSQCQCLRLKGVNLSSFLEGESANVSISTQACNVAENGQARDMPRMGFSDNL